MKRVPSLTATDRKRLNLRRLRACRTTRISFSAHVFVKPPASHHRANRLLVVVLVLISVLHFIGIEPDAGREVSGHTQTATR